MSFSERAAALSDEQLEALTRAGVWYANYFAREIATEANESHAYAVDERRSYLSLVEALQTLGIRFALPDELRQHLSEAA